MTTHAQINQMESAIRNFQVTAQKIRDFKRWMEGSKFPEELREEAETLLKKAEQLRKDGNADSGYRTPPQYKGGARGLNNRENLQTPIRNSDAAPASVIGYPFHNPYTFIPFPKNSPERKKTTPLTIDEVEKDRMTGVISLKLKTLSPLLIPDPSRKRQPSSKEPAEIPLQRVGEDVVVPASSIRGVLRSLCAIITESALDYVDDELWLCQGRDLSLKNKSGKYFLAEIMEKGDRFHDGKVRVGEAVLVKTNSLAIEDKIRPEYMKKNGKQLWIDNPRSQHPNISNRQDEKHPFRVKVSGRKVNQNGIQHEGAFRPDTAKEITLQKELWQTFTGRYRNAEKKELQNGDLVWLEAKEPEKGIQTGADVESIQWARWGREGTSFIKVLENRCKHMCPDSIRNDGLVDITSDLFGYVPISKDGTKIHPAFAARIRTENLIFRHPKYFENPMPVRSSPHPGCRAFYSWNDNYDEISSSDLPRGYKVYRTSLHQDEKDAPWIYHNQPIFQGGTERSFQNVADNTTKNELLKTDSEGTLKIAYRALTQKEFSLLLLLLSCDLRIGGGKPFGLGHCLVTEIKAYNEFGERFLEWDVERAKVPEQFKEGLSKRYLERAVLYCKTQIPVSMLRYPRAVKGYQRGGMCWFGYFAAPKKSSQNKGDNQSNKSSEPAKGIPQKGLETIETDGQLKERAGGKDQIKAQALPLFDPFHPESDLLYGYDVMGFSENNRRNSKKIKYSKFEPPSKPYQGARFENQSPNRQSRKKERSQR